MSSPDAGNRVINYGVCGIPVVSCVKPIFMCCLLLVLCVNVCCVLVPPDPTRLQYLWHAHHLLHVSLSISSLLAPYGNRNVCVRVIRRRVRRVGVLRWGARLTTISGATAISACLNLVVGCARGESDSASNSLKLYLYVFLRAKTASAP